MAPVSVLGCVQEYMNVTRATNFTIPVPIDPNMANKGIMWIYKISYVWYSMIGCFLVVIIGLVVSVLTGCTKPSDLNPRLISPLYNFVCKTLLPQSLQDKFMVKAVEQYDKERMIALGRAGMPQTISSIDGNANKAYVPSDDHEMTQVVGDDRTPQVEASEVYRRGSKASFVVNQDLNGAHQQNGASKNNKEPVVLQSVTPHKDDDAAPL